MTPCLAPRRHRRGGLPRAFTMGAELVPRRPAAALAVNAGGSDASALRQPVNSPFLHKDIAVGVGGFISDSATPQSRPVPSRLPCCSSVPCCVGGDGDLYAKQDMHQVYTAGVGR